MKKIFLSLLSMGIFSALMQTATAQKDPSKDSKEEIIIRRNGDQDSKVTIEMKDDDILINGKPMSEFNDSNLTVMKRKEIMRRGSDMLLSPRGENRFFYNDDNEDEPRPLLGVTTEKNDAGAKINNVSKGSAAEKAGLKEGDIITKVGDKTIAGPEDLINAVRSYKPKNEVKIFYQRNGKSTDTKAILGERKVTRSETFSFNSDDMPQMDENMVKDFKFEMPPMPKQPFNFWMAQNKKLGVKIEDTDDESGARIKNVDEGSAAEKAGLKKDDIIAEVDGKKVKNTAEARQQVLENEKPGYTIKAKRGSAMMSFEVKIPKKLNSADL